MAWIIEIKTSDWVMNKLKHRMSTTNLVFFVDTRVSTNWNNSKYRCGNNNGLHICVRFSLWSMCFRWYHEYTNSHYPQPRQRWKQMYFQQISWKYSALEGPILKGSVKHIYANRFCIQGIVDWYLMYLMILKTRLPRRHLTCQRL